MKSSLLLFWESIFFAINALKVNLLRTILSLLGVTIGIFVIISVLCMVDSMERNVKDSFKVVGEKVIYVVKWPMLFEKDYPWWRYFKRPEPSFEDFKLLKKNLTSASAVAISATKGRNTITFNNSSVDNIALQGFTYEFDQTVYFQYEYGRYFTEHEVEAARNVIILGSDINKEIFNSENPVDKVVKVNGYNFTVIGVLKKQGNSLIGMSTDDGCFIPYHTLAKMVSLKGRSLNPWIGVRCKQEVSVEEMESEIIGVMRSIRRLKPAQENNFSLNRIEMIVKAMDSVFGVMGIVGWIIGGFATLVGGFGIANIMFVSVKERTNIIGIQKALGARNSFILSEFLVESILLSMIGGGTGIIFVFLATLGLDAWMGEVFRVQLSAKNILVGFSISGIIGTLAGLLPAMAASRLNPVDAIRSK